MRLIILILLLAGILTGCGMEAEVLSKGPTGHAVDAVKEVSEENGIEPKVYFCPRDNCSMHLAELIMDAKESVHCAFFDLDLENVINALNEKESEADVKVVVDNDNEKEVRGLEFIRFDNKNQLSHNKFCVIDSKIVWTGSFNPTVRCDTKNNNNAVVYESRYLAENYEDEFKELWDGVFGKGGFVKNKKIILNGKTIENYFCPEDRCADRVVEVIDSAEESVYFMTFSFTHDLIGNALVKMHNAGADVKGVFEKSQKNDWTEFDVLQQYGVKVKWDKNPANMHHKVFVIDGAIVATGSFNPTANGDERNDENVLIIHDAAVAELFLEEFENVYIE